jgi:Protein of unknown function (DUF3396)
VTAPDRFLVTDDQGRELTRLVADVTIYCDIPLRERRDEVLKVLDSYFDIVPKERFRWYLTETMGQFKPATRHTFSIPAIWWKNGARRKDLRELTIKSGAAHTSTATSSVTLRSAEPEARLFQKKANYLRFSFPPGSTANDHEQLLEFTISLASRIPFISGHAGFAIECNPYYQNEAETAAWALAMRYHAVDIATLSRSAWAVRGGRIKTVSWLTLVGSELLEKVGGVESLRRQASPLVGVIETAFGVVIRAGEKPILGDVNRREHLGAYVEVYRLLDKLHDGIESHFAAFSVPGSDDDEATRRWLTRFARTS